MKDGQYISAYDWAMAYSGLGEKQETLDWLQKAYQERNGRLVNLGGIRNSRFCEKEPAFQELVSRWRVANPEATN